MFSEEELLSFEGDLPCQGRVRIESFDGETRWLLMGENNTKASNICHVMQCGSLKSFVPAQNMTHANVTCSGTGHVTPQCLIVFNLLSNCNFLQACYYLLQDIM